MWVTDIGRDKIYAYHMYNQSRDADNDFDTLDAVMNRSPYDLWSDGTTMWVADGTARKVFSYNMPLSNNAKLSSISVNNRNIHRFDPGHTTYEVGLASNVTQATLTATHLHPDATNIEFGPAPDASRRTGYQINLEPGANKGTFVRVTAEDEVSTETYYINLNRGVDEEFGWKAAKDIDNLDTTSRYDLATIMRHGNTTWLGNGFRDILFAYNDDGSRDESRDIELHADNDNLSDTWTDGTNVWVLDLTDRRIYVYRLSDGTRQNSREFSVRSGPRSIWSDGTTMWVGSSSLPTVYAYRLDNGQRQSERDITLRGGQSNTWAMWGDGAILWVAGPAESGQPIVEAYNLATRARHPEFEFGTPSAIGNNDIISMWGDQDTLWMADSINEKVYTYNTLRNNFLRPPQVPHALYNVYSDERDTALSLAWPFPYSDTRVPTTAYRVRHRRMGTSRWTNANRAADDDSTEQLITGLTNRQNYEVQVAAVNRIGTGPYASGSNVPQAPPTPPEDPPGADDSLDVGALGGHWTDGPGNDNFHTDSHGLNMIFACAEPQSFRVFWHEPRARDAIEVGRQADEWQAHLITRGRAGVVSYQFRPEYRRPSSAGLYATVQLHGPGSVTVRVRGRFGDDGWGVWSDPMGFYCFDEADHPARGEPAQDAEPAPQNNQPATGKPAITGSPNPGETLGVDTSGLADPNGMTNAEFTYQWLRYDGSSDTGIAGATGATYTVTDGDTGQEIRVRVSFTDDEDHEESATSNSVYVQAPQPLYGGFDADTVPGSHDGEVAFTFQVHFSESPELGWEAVRDHVLQVTNGDVTGARRTTGGSNIRWEITLEPGGDGDVTVTLPATTDCAAQGAVCTSSGKMLSNQTGITVPGPGEAQEQQQEETPANTAATGQPVINGTAQVGQTLTASTSGIADEDGLDNATFSYQWIRNDGNADSDISGATGSTHTLKAADEGKTIKVRVSFSDDGENEETLTSAATVAVAAAPPINTPATGVPTISGTAQVGETLTASTSGIADADGLDNAAFSYQWIRNNGNADSDISGATGSTHILVADDEGKTIKVRVSFTDDAGNEETLTSAATDSVAGLPSEPLTASLEATPSGHDGENAFTFELRFSEEVSLSYETLRDHAFTVTGGTVEKAQRLEKPSNIGWRITVEPDSSATVTVVLPITENCDDQGAICTEDGRMLSTRLELSVGGPGG